MRKNQTFKAILWFFEGIIVGFGAILPGISGGALCVAFGMYMPLMETLSAPRTGIRKYWKMLGVFLLGAGAGFLGLSGLASWLMKKNIEAVTCAFIGFIFGTFPELWRDAGQYGRKFSSWLSLCVSFLLMLLLLALLKSYTPVTLEPGIWSFLLCGVLWGISFVVPGLSSSTLLLFFGLYQPMLDGIARWSMQVLIPLAFGAALCLLLLPRLVHSAYQKHHAILSHAILGIVAATTVMILPAIDPTPSGIAIAVACICGGAVFSYFLSRLCERLKQAKTEEN